MKSVWLWFVLTFVAFSACVGTGFAIAFYAIMYLA